MVSVISVARAISHRTASATKLLQKITMMWKLPWSNILQLYYKKTDRAKVEICSRGQLTWLKHLFNGENQGLFQFKKQQNESWEKFIKLLGMGMNWEGLVHEFDGPKSQARPLAQAGLDNFQVVSVLPPACRKSLGSGTS